MARPRRTLSHVDARGRVRMVKDPVKVAQDWRRRAEARSLSIRELMIEVNSRTTFVGTPSEVAEQIDRHVQDDAADGFVLVPHLTPHGLDEFVDTVVPLLQERGVFRADYTHGTLRGHLDLPPVRANQRSRS